jgi:hypothetical protein
LELIATRGQIAYRTLNRTRRFIQVIGQAGEALKWFNLEMRFKRSDTLSMANWEFLSSWAQINLSCQVLRLTRLLLSVLLTPSLLGRSLQLQQDGGMPVKKCKVVMS